MLSNNIFTIDQVVEKIDRIGIKCVKVFSGVCEITENMNTWQMVDILGDPECEKDTDLVNIVKQWAKDNPGTYTMWLLSTKGQRKDSTPLLPVRINAHQEINTAQIVQGNIDPAKIREDIMRELKDQQERERVITENEFLKAKIATMDTASDKLAQVATKILQGFFPGQQAQPVPLNGTELNNLEQAFTVLIDKLGEQTIINLAYKIESGQAAQYIPIIKNFANG